MPVILFILLYLWGGGTGLIVAAECVLVTQPMVETGASDERLGL